MAIAMFSARYVEKATPYDLTKQILTHETTTAHF